MAFSYDVATIAFNFYQLLKQMYAALRRNKYRSANPTTFKSVTGLLEVAMTACEKGNS